MDFKLDSKHCGYIVVSVCLVVVVIVSMSGGDEFNTMKTLLEENTDQVQENAVEQTQEVQEEIEDIIDISANLTQIKVLPEKEKENIEYSISNI